MCAAQALEAEENASVKQEISARVSQLQSNSDGTQAERLLAELRGIAMKVGRLPMAFLGKGWEW